jgi:hypothetical protein
LKRVAVPIRDDAKPLNRAVRANDRGLDRPFTGLAIGYNHAHDFFISIMMVPFSPEPKADSGKKDIAVRSGA